MNYPGSDQASLVTLTSNDSDAPSVVELHSTRGCSAAYLQLRDVSLAAAGGRLQGYDLTLLLEELHGYLDGQQRHFTAYTKAPDHPEFQAALAQIHSGLLEFRGLVEEAMDNHTQMSPPDWASLLEDGGFAEDALRLGVEMLDLVEAE